LLSTLLLLLYIQAMLTADHQGPAVQHFLNRFSTVEHHKAEIGDISGAFSLDAYFNHWPKFFKELLQLLLQNAVRQIAHKQLVSVRVAGSSRVFFHGDGGSTAWSAVLPWALGS
jgi:hypothetical protein